MRISFVVSVMLWAGAISPARAQTPATADTQPPSVALPPDLDRVLRDYEKAWKSGDAANVAALFAVDGFVLASGRSPVRGRAAITSLYGGMAGGDLRLRAFAYAAGDTVGYILGAYTYGDAKTDMGKFTVTLRRQPGGRWELFSDMDNGNARRQSAAPPPTPAAGSNVSPEVLAGVKRELAARYAENEAGFFARDKQ